MKFKSEWTPSHEVGTVTFQGREFSAQGASFNGDRATGYVALRDGRLVLVSWGGDLLGTDGVVVSSWRRHSMYSPGTRMYQIEFTIGARRYTGRGEGEGMLWRGRLKVVRRRESI